MTPFSYQVRVRYSEVDQLGVAYYAHYLSWFEEARVEFLRHAGFSYADLEKKGIKLPVIHCEISYVTPARYDDVLDVRTHITRLGRTSLVFQYEVVQHATHAVVAKAETTLACVNEHMKPIRIPDFLRPILPEEVSAGHPGGDPKTRPVSRVKK